MAPTNRAPKTVSRPVAAPTSTAPEGAEVDRFLPLKPTALQVLLALAEAPKHGWAIMKEVSRNTDGRLTLNVGTLYGLLKRLLAQELIAESDDRPPAHWDDERRRYYRLTELGRRVVLAEVERLEQVLALAKRTSLQPAEVES